MRHAHVTKTWFSLQAKSVVNEYLEAKSSYAETVQDSEEIERRAKDAGVQLVMAEEQLGMLKREIQQLQNVKMEQEALLEDIKQVVIPFETLSTMNVYVEIFVTI